MTELLEATPDNLKNTVSTAKRGVATFRVSNLAELIAGIVSSAETINNLRGSIRDVIRCVILPCIESQLNRTGLPEGCNADDGTIGYLLGHCNNVRDELNLGGGASINEDMFPRFLDKLKRVAGARRRDNNAPPILKQITWLLDTCYDENRGKRLKAAFEKIEGRLGNPTRTCGALLLLAAAYAGMLRNPSEVQYYEWYPYLLRGVALADAGSGERPILPVCPGRGDLAALAYYIYMRCRRVGNISVNVPELLGELLKLERGGRGIGGGQQGGGQRNG